VSELSLQKLHRILSSIEMQEDDSGDQTYCGICYQPSYKHTEDCELKECLDEIEHIWNE